MREIIEMRCNYSVDIKNCSLTACCLTEEAVTRSTLIRLPPQELVGTFPRGEGKA